MVQPNYQLFNKTIRIFYRKNRQYKVNKKECPLFPYREDNKVAKNLKSNNLAPKKKNLRLEILHLKIPVTTPTHPSYRSI
jgi:hypothetical protein